MFHSNLFSFFGILWCNVELYSLNEEREMTGGADEMLWNVPLKTQNMTGVNEAVYYSCGLQIIPAHGYIHNMWCDIVETI